MNGLLTEVRLAARSWRRARSLIAATVVTIALGVGLGGSVLALAQTVWWRALPFDSVDELVVMWRSTEHLDRSSLSYLNYEDWRDRNRSFSSVSLLLPGTTNFAPVEGPPARWTASVVSHDLTMTLGIDPVAGRHFASMDDVPGAPKTALISEELWRSAFEEREELLTVPIRLDGEAVQVIGVLPAAVAGQNVGGVSLGDVWFPFGSVQARYDVAERASRIGIVPVGRLASGVTLSEARSDMARVARELEAEYPLSNPKNMAHVERLAIDQSASLVPATRALGLVTLLLLSVVAANLVGLQLVRHLDRLPEYATRLALGGRLAGLLRAGLVDAALLCGVGLALAALVARGAIGLLPSWFTNASLVDRVELSWSVILGMAGLSLLLAVVATLLPFALSHRSLMSWRVEAGQRRTGGRSFVWGQRTLVVAELALAMALLVGAMATVLGLRSLQAEDLGFRAGDQLTFQVSPPDVPYADRESWTRLFDHALETLEQSPVVDQAAFAETVPLLGGRGGSRVLAGDRAVPPVPQMEVSDWLTLSHDGFETLGLRLLTGRQMRPQDDDRTGAPKVIWINRALAERFWPERAARDLAGLIGERVAFELDGTPADFQPIWRDVVGIVENARYDGPSQAGGHLVYVPLRQRPLWLEGAAVAMVGTVSPSIGASRDTVISAVRGAFAEIDPELPIFDVRTLNERLGSMLERPRLLSGLLAGAAFLAVLLTVLGVWALLHHALASRRRVLAIRGALGAPPRALAGGLVRESVCLFAAGLAGGVPLALMLGRALKGEIAAVGSLGPVTCAAGIALLSVVALSAFGPARRAARLEIARVLRR